MDVRLAYPQDIGKLSILWLAMCREIGQDSPNVELWQAMCRMLMAGDKYYVFVAETEEGHMAGFLDGMLYAEPSTGLMHMVAQHFYVVPEYRQTVPAMLYRFGRTLAEELAAKKIDIFCSPKNSPFWEKHGFKVERILMRGDV